MARPKKPIVLHKLHGTARKDRLERRITELIVPAGPVGDAPEYLTADAKEEWNRITGHELYSQILSPIHRGTLVEYCALYGKMTAWAKGKGELTASERQTLNSLRMQLGITPASQSKVRLPNKPEEKSKWEKFGPRPIQNAV